MKKYIVPIIFILVLFSCKKEAPLSILNEAENEAKLKNEACFNDKKLPTSEVGFAYVEGEIDGKLFRITEGKDGFTASQNVTDFFYGYDSKYLDIEKQGNTWWGIGYSFIPVDDNLPSLSVNKNLYFQIQFPYFRGDSVKYNNYLKQFEEIGKSFPIGETPDDATLQKKFETNFNLRILMKGCSGQETYFVNAYGSQKDAFFRLKEVKYYRNRDKIYRRDDRLC